MLSRMISASLCRGALGGRRLLLVPASCLSQASRVRPAAAAFAFSAAAARREAQSPSWFNPHSIVAGSILRQFEGFVSRMFFCAGGAHGLGLGVWRLHSFGREIRIAVESAYGCPVREKVDDAVRCPAEQ